MNNSSVKIRISRNRQVAQDRAVAILKLNKINHYVGQPVMVKYYTSSGKIDTIFAMGVKDGIGEDCYRVISLGGLELVRDVVGTLPNISDLVHGEQYLYQDPNNGRCYFVYLSNNEKVVDPIDSIEPTTFVSIDDKFRWFWNGKTLTREDDFTSSSDLKVLIEDLFLIIGPPKLEITNLSGNLFAKGETVNIKLKVKVINSVKEDITNLCKFYCDDVEVPVSNGTIEIKGLNDSKDLVIEARATAVSGETYKYSVVLPIEFGYDFYFGGVSEDWEITEDNIKNLPNKSIHTRSTVEYNSIKLNYQRVVYAYPEIYGELLHAYDEHGFDYIGDYLLYKQQVGDLIYNIYLKEDPISVSGFDQTFMFEDIDEDDDIPGTVDEEKYDEVLKAWDTKNTAKGLVTLNSIGKIPSDFITGLDFSSEYSFIELEGIVNDYPEQTGLVPGSKWYNKETKKIFEAITESTGKIYSPVNKSVYLNKEDMMFYLWTDSEDDMDKIGETIQSKEVRNITDILD